MRPLLRAVVALALILGSVLPAPAARPLLDQHQWDAYFAMFAPNSEVPWKPAVVRIDTYSGAPVDFAVYNVDPAAVIVAGQNRSARALDTSHLRPLARWRFTPPPGYRFASNDVQVPLGSQEGFYVVEARRGDAVQQVWLNRTHIGLVTQESPLGLVVWGVDLRGGSAIRNMDVDFLVGLRLVRRRTAGDGTIVWTDAARPSFALAQSGAGRAFVSLLPAAPVPATVVGIRLAESVVRAGGVVRAAGFVRRLGAGGYRRATGSVRIGLVGAGRSLALSTVRLDAAGAFEATVPVPVTAVAGTYSVLATAPGGVGGTSVRVDPAGDLVLGVTATCPCAPGAPVPIVVTAARGSAAGAAPDVPGPVPEAAAAAGTPVHLEVVRIPHALPPGAVDGSDRWGTTVVADRTLRTGGDGVATETLLPPTDGLDSTYVVRATAAGATATTRVTVAAATLALDLEPDAAAVAPGVPVGFVLRAFRLSDGSPMPGVTAVVRLSHGSTVRTSRVTLDQTGSRRLSLPDAGLGSNLALASATTGDGRTVLDAASVDVAPRALTGTTASADSDLTIATDRGRYAPHDRVLVRAFAPAASGQALLALAGDRTVSPHVASVAQGHASASLDLNDVRGDVRAHATFVRDGAIATTDQPVQVDGPGRPRATDLVLDQASYPPSSTIHATIRDGPPEGALPNTIVVRVSDGRVDGASSFADLPDVLASGGTSVQASASDNIAWHAWVSPSRTKTGDLFGSDGARSIASDLPNLGAVSSRTVFWQIVRQSTNSFDLTAPRRRGHYVLSVLKMQPSGEVGTAQVSFDVA